MRLITRLQSKRVMEVHLNSLDFVSDTILLLGLGPIFLFRVFLFFPSETDSLGKSDSDVEIVQVDMPLASVDYSSVKAESCSCVKLV